jgi:hypothetical protein
VSGPSHEWHLTETYKGLITLSVEALKMLAIVNGGAAIAVLTYLGNLVSHASGGQRTPDVIPALQWYCWGLAATMAAFVVAYVSQLLLFGEERRHRRGSKATPWHSVGVWAGVLLALFSTAAEGQQFQQCQPIHKTALDLGIVTSLNLIRSNDMPR